MNYPGGIKPKTNGLIQYANRGMSLEYDINLTNEYYRDNNIAYIYKKPTPIQIVKVNYPSRDKAIIKEAYFKEPSTTDYNGLYKGKYIDFEAKETNNTSFPISNIHAHQIEHIKNIHNNGGICFIIIRFNKINTTYLLKASDFLFFINTETRKSIPLSYIKEKGMAIEIKYSPRLDYIKIIDQLMEVSNDN